MPADCQRPKWTIFKVFQLLVWTLAITRRHKERPFTAVTGVRIPVGTPLIQKVAEMQPFFMASCQPNVSRKHRGTDVPLAVTPMRVGCLCSISGFPPGLALPFQPIQESVSISMLSLGMYNQISSRFGSTSVPQGRLA